VSDVIWYTHRENALYLLIEGDGNWLEDSKTSTFVATTGYLITQFAAELIATIAFKLGSINGRFYGSVTSTVYSLRDEDFWGESEAPTIRSWRREGPLFRYYPYTLADVRTATRCGHPAVDLDSGLTIVMSRSGDGITFAPITRSTADTVLEMIGGYGIPTVENDAPFDGYIDESGYFTV
jgi:hypothetical protein